LVEECRPPAYLRDPVGEREAAVARDRPHPGSPSDDFISILRRHIRGGFSHGLVMQIPEEDQGLYKATLDNIADSFAPF
jgi:hypothetical protein